MKYRLLTGATGLLGSYLMRDLVVSETPLVAVVRPSRFADAQSRIDALLSHWECLWERSLLRPVVLAGDITQPLLGLDRGDLDWLRRRCDHVLHSAASLTFEEKDGEPRRSNVQGTQHVLDICREAAIPFLEYVSTAYTCGLRTDRVYENELDVGQDFGNDYERSKAAAENLVRGDRHLTAYAIFRPSIIVGDSRTGYTTTFHGFYTPLRIVAALLTAVGLEEALNVNYLTLLGMTGNERKNFVPVDWVSAALVAILTRAPIANQTYALTSPRPVAVGRLQRLFEEVVRIHQARIEEHVASRGAAHKSPSGNGRVPAIEAFQEHFVDQFSVYRSYWRDDPDFDTSNTRALLPDLPCPEMTDARLTLLCEYAMKANYGFPPPRSKPLEFSPRDWMERHGIRSEKRLAEETDEHRLGLVVTGPGGGSWAVSLDEQGKFFFTVGGNEGAASARLSSDSFLQLVSGRISLREALGQGRVLAFGNGDHTSRLEAFTDVAQALGVSGADDGFAG